MIASHRVSVAPIIYVKNPALETTVVVPCLAATLVVAYWNSARRAMETVMQTMSVKGL